MSIVRISALAAEVGAAAARSADFSGADWSDNVGIPEAKGPRLVAGAFDV